MQFEEYNLNINGALLPYLINGDASGLEDWEIAACDALAAQYPCAVYEPEEEPSFSVCDVTDLRGDCYRTTIWVPAEREVEA